ncbi:MAG: FGGY family carbohydrate kinase [Eubacteriales bacterium]
MTEQFNVQPAPQRKVLGIEFGSTRIKAVLTDGHGAVLATGSHTWENQLVNGIWTYPLEQVWNGLQACYRDMADRYRMRYGSSITVLDAIGFSGMMHGYLAFDRDGNQLVPFRTWRNTITDRAADLLTKQFSFNIPQRWSIAHLYQAILNEEAHVSSIDYLTTLAGYVHWQLTGERVLGVGEASGMFPIDSAAMTYDADMADRFDRLVAGHHFRWKLLDILPRVLPAGVQAGRRHRRVHSCWIRPASCSPVHRSVRRKATPEPAWSRQTRSPSAPAMYRQAPPFSQWSCWSARSVRYIRRSTW